MNGNCDGKTKDGKPCPNKATNELSEDNGARYYELCNKCLQGGYEAPAAKQQGPMPVESAYRLHTEQ